jgi:hypothetical protein
MAKNKENLGRRIDEWKEKVLDACEGKGAVNTYKMMVDIDRIIAEEFGHDTVFSSED